MSMRWCGLLLAICSGPALICVPAQSQQTSTYRFSVSFPKEQSAQPIDGRILLLLSTDGSAEPRMQITGLPRTQMIFGLDVDAMKPGDSITVDDTSFGYPIRHLHDVPPGEYSCKPYCTATKRSTARTATP
jgi:hypothetical protein